MMRAPWGGRWIAAITFLSVLLSNGCMLRDLNEQVRMMDRACVIEGRVQQGEGGGQAVVVVLTMGNPESEVPPSPVDFTLPDPAGGFSFAVAPGQYRLLAFEDTDGDLELDDDEPASRADGEGALACGAGDRLRENPISLKSGDRLEGDRTFYIQEGRNLVAGAMQSAASLGQLTAFGEVVPLSDPRFDLDRARDSLWRPLDFIREGYVGVYLSEPLDPERTPVLFIHGINGSPRVLEPLIQHLDGEQFQPMYFYYASGLRIGQIAWHLERIMRELEHRRDIDRYHVVAHSMGGLVARAWLLERSRQGPGARVASFVSLSTPWSGYPSARQGVDHSPVVVPVWRDMATGSDFLDGLFGQDAALEDLPPHHLLFSFRQSGWLPGSSGDDVAALASMLPPQVQRQAASVFGVDVGHVEILSDPTAQDWIERLLSGPDQGRGRTNQVPGP